MYCSRKSGKVTESIHKRALRVAYNDFNQALKIFCRKKWMSGYIKITYTVNSVNPVFMKAIFQSNEIAYNLRNQSFIQKS